MPTPTRVVISQAGGHGDDQVAAGQRRRARRSPSAGGSTSGVICVSVGRWASHMVTAVMR